MHLNLFQNNSDKNVMWKQITTKANLEGTLREDCSIIDPIIRVEGISGADLPYINYCEIVEFGRYYYIKDIVLVGNLYELRCHIDVLMTYKDQLRNIPAVIARNEAVNNVMLQDGMIKTYADPIIEIRKASGSFTDFQYIFTVAG